MLYFLQPVGGGPIKIGTTTKLRLRLAQLRVIYGVDLVVLATREGGRIEEQEIHRRFAHLRFGSTEQFQPASDLIEFIGSPEAVGGHHPESMPMSLPPTLLNLKGSEDERDRLKRLSKLTGVSLSEIGRRGIAKWAAGRGHGDLFKDWNGQ